MKFQYPSLLLCLTASFAQANDVENACFNCPPLSKVADANNFNDSNYYANAITAITNNFTAEEIKNSLSEVITNNHKNLSYAEVWTALTKTDQDPNNSDNVILLYRGISLAKSANGSGSQSQDPDNWNREHVWAKSHGFAASDLEAYTDIHHLRPTDMSVNSSRGNLDFDNSDAPLSEAPENRVDADSFEPRDSVKGDVARMIFYMDTRYQGMDNTPDLTVVDRLTSTGEPSIGRLCRLLEWHAADPVDSFEQMRNDTIYEFQGNRNPFIDHPEWVSKIYQADACADDNADDNGGDNGDNNGGDNGDDNGSANSATLIISEYVEGSGYNKAIELFNPAASSVDLSSENYQLGRFSNGGNSATMINLQGTIAPQGTFVIASNRAADTLKELADQQSSQINHNGDDGYILYRDNEVVDSFGQIGQDPGSAWGSGEFSTKDNSLRRNNDIVNGDTITDDDFDPSIQWTGSNKDNFDNLGQHSILNPEIFISEYIEGSSYNKALELYNPAAIAIDFSVENYQLVRFSNGKTTPDTIDLIGTVPPQGTFVIAHTSAAASILAIADQLSGKVSHNGDDAYVLYHNNQVIDSFGRVGEDPGSEWGSGTTSTANNTLVRISAVKSGDLVIDDAFDPAVQWSGYANNTFDYLGTHNIDNDNNTQPNNNLGVCFDPSTKINQVQGASDASPLLNETHIVEAVVTSVFPALNGFFVQEENADQDNNVMTSEGLFILNSNNNTIPNHGDIVRVIGKVSEYYGKTQLEASQDLLQCGTTTVSATELVLPFASAAAQEALEGMYLSVNTALTVTDNYNLARYGEVTLSSDRLYAPTNIHPPGSAEVNALSVQNALNKILLDDGINGSNPADIIYPSGGLTASNTLRAGDKVSNLIGALDYSFGNYRIIPTEQPVFEFSNARTATPQLSTQGNLTIASFNVLNYFNGDGLGGGYPTARGASNAEEFSRQRAKIIAAISAMNADIIGILEMENDGFGEQSAIRDLINGLNAIAPQGVNYSFVEPNIAVNPETGIAELGGDKIKVALIYNDQKVTETGTAAYLTDFPFEYHNRPPMAQTFALNSNSESITVAINHFRSKGCSSSGGVENEDKNDGQGCYNLRRVQAAQATVAWLANNPTGVAEDNIILLGDLNAYTKEDPITTIEQAGYSNLTALFAGQWGYSYTYQGQSGTLDHALASAALTPQVLDLTEWHINADEPKALDYNTEYKTAEQIAVFYQDDAYRASDHDPIVISINLVAPIVKGDWDQDGDVDINDIRAFLYAIQMRLPIELTFDLNNDGIVNISDVRFMITLCTRLRCAV